MLLKGSWLLMAASLFGAPVAASDCATVVLPVGVGLSGSAPVNTLHPVLTTSSDLDRDLYRLLFRAVALPNATGGVDWRASLAQSIDVSDGGAMYRVTLKPYSWSDGVPVTADDVLYCWELIRQIGPAFSNYGTGGIPTLVRSLTVTGPRTFEIRTVRPLNPDWFETNGIDLLYALPRHVWGRWTIEQQRTLQSETSFYPVVDGAFRLERLQPGRYAAFRPNESFGGQHPAMKRLVVTFLEGADPLEDLRSGQVDMVNLPLQLWDATRSLPGFETVRIGPEDAAWVIVPDLQSPTAPFLADGRVRRAMAIAIDQRRIVQVVFHGQGSTGQGFVPAGDANFLPPGLRDGRLPLAFDPARARAMLEAAGWRVGADGVRRRGGARLSLEVLTTVGLPTGLTLLQLVRSDLAAVGIELRIREMDFNQIMAHAAGPGRDWDAVFLAQPVPGFPDATPFFRTGSGQNLEHYSDAATDRLIDASTTAPGPDALFALQNQIVAQQPEIFLPSADEVVLVRPGLGGVRRFVDQGGEWSPEYLTLSGGFACR